MRLLVAVLLAGLSLPSTASAKEVVGATICGAESCRTLSGAEVGHDVWPDSTPAESPRAAPFVRVSVDVRAEEGELVTVESVFVPSLGLIGGDEGWMRPIDGTGLERLARGLEPFPASEMPGAAAPAPSAPASPPPVDRSSPAWIVAALGAVLALLGLTAFVRERRGPVALP
jgi:hypothetical protein